MNLAHLSVVDIQGAVNAKGTKIMGCEETSSVVNVAQAIRRDFSRKVSTEDAPESSKALTCTFSYNRKR